jgi:hypothetical protein
MSTTFDAGELSHELQALLARPHLRKLAIVLPLGPGASEFVHDLLAEGPPFDPRAAGVTTHEVLLTHDEAIFVFGLADGPQTLERILGDEDFWTVVSSWERVAGGRPRLAEVAYDWRAADEPPA